ncbi:hypothetical protein [Streptomyces fuscigenes]|uniref:hypothetical protein n=1 Tax=Streptomyces fuscigenes TaxID=1528880 RepID=UPI001F210FF2|nr:hypothetical protein [Streptomyces fuscigenes]MCF3960339.1 hypothetical protein [Streptomyces fuscigenes]
MLDLIVRIAFPLLFMSLVLGALCGRVLTDREAALAEGHDPSTCRDCAQLRHPSQREARQGLAAIPRQTRGGDR